jgi:Xaa-Pro aminopeptidase
MPRSRIPITALAWLALLPRSALAQDAPLFRADFPPEELQARRAGIYDAIGTGAVALVQGAPAPAGYLRFRQTNELYYLCGVETPGAYLLLDGSSRQTRLYLPHRNAAREASEGRLLSAEDEAELRRLTGVEQVHGAELLSDQ